MPNTLELVQIDNGVGVILPDDMRARLKLQAGDSIFLIETPDGLHLTPYDPDFSAKLDAARDIMGKRRSAARPARLIGPAPHAAQPTFTGTSVIVSLPKMSITFTAAV